MLVLKIPVYTMTKQQFIKKYNNYRLKFFSLNSADYDKKNSIFNVLHPNIYEYDNVIVGFIEIYINYGVLEYQLVNTYSRKKDGELKQYMPQIDTHIKHYMSREPINGFHIDIKGKANSVIVKEIMENIHEITTKYFGWELYIDRENFEPIIEAIDYQYFLDK